MHDPSSPTSKGRRRSLVSAVVARLAVLAVLLAGALVAHPAPAAAAPPEPPSKPATKPSKPPSLTFSATRSNTAQGKGTDARPPTITCYVWFDQPFVIAVGGPFNTSMIAHNVLVVCTYPVDQLSVEDTLMWNRINVWSFDGDSRVLTTSVSAAPTEECVDGLYHAVVHVRVWFPPGYLPNPSDGTWETPPVWYDC